MADMIQLVVDERRKYRQVAMTSIVLYFGPEESWKYLFQCWDASIIIKIGLSDGRGTIKNSTDDKPNTPR